LAKNVAGSGFSIPTFRANILFHIPKIYFWKL